MYYLLFFLASGALIEAEDTSCALLGNKPTNRTSLVGLVEHSSIFNESLLTICYPLCGTTDVYSFVNWYLNVTKYVTFLLSGSLNSSFISYKTKEIKLFYQNCIKNINYSAERLQIVSHALLSFVNYAKWQRIAIITDASNYVYLTIVEQLYSAFESDFDISIFQIFHSETIVHRTLSRIRKLKFRVIIVSLPKKLLNLVMCASVNLDMNWPSYAWLAVDLDDHSSISNIYCRQQLIVFQSPCLTYNQISNVVSIYMWNDEILHLISSYNLSGGLSQVNLSFIPADLILESLLVFYIVNSTIIIVVGIFLTSVLILYLNYRNKPDIKATGVSLNLLTFLGCYLLLLYLVLLNFNALPNSYRPALAFAKSMCKLQLWFNGLSIPAVLIQAILLVKLIRVFRLFHFFHVINKWRYKDVTLSLYALVLTSPVVLVCTIQTALDPHDSVLTTTTYRGVPIAYYECKSDSEFFWLLAQQVYIFLLSIALIVMAIKTRNIEHARFKDTKKVIALVFVSLVTSLGTVGYYIIFEVIKTHPLYGYLLLSVSHALFIIECQFFLFLPKILPLVKEKVISLQ